MPDDCWIAGGGTKLVYLDIYSKKPYIKFKVLDGGKFELITDNRTKLSSYKAKSLKDTLELEKDRVLSQYEDAISRTVEFVNNHPDVPYNISISGGKDSEVLYHLWYEVLNRLEFKPDYEFLFFNTTNEVADVYKYIKAKPEIRIVNPKVGWYQFIKNHNYLLPSTFRRFCCSVYKEGQIKKEYDNNSPRVQVIGMRKSESAKRSRYEFYMDYTKDVEIHGTSNQPMLWSKLCPIINFANADIWLLILLKKMYIQPKYKYGWTRVGCAICPFSNSYEDELNKRYYPFIWKKFTEIATHNYYYYYYYLLGISLEDWINGAWKTPVSVDNKYLSLPPTPENIKAYAEYKGISIEMASKFWNNICGKCGQKISPIAISMFYKYYGRYEGMEDNRKPLCKKCFLKENNMSNKEFYQIAHNYKEQGCELF